MGRLTKLVVSVVTLGLASAAFAGVAGAGSTLSKKAYLKEGNSICDDVNEQIGAVFRVAFEGIQEGEQPSLEQMQEAVDGAVDALRAGLGAIEELEGPSGLDKKVDTVIELYTTAMEELVDDPASAFDEDGPTQFDKADKQAKKVGLKKCVQNA